MSFRLKGEMTLVSRQRLEIYFAEFRVRFLFSEMTNWTLDALLCASTEKTLEPQQLRILVPLKRNHRRILHFTNHKHTLCTSNML